ncbi:MAG: type IV secretion system protein, partial [Candidatus Margulisbacteria bacterium]|nr:type IV secretion system protein [Candidatus Margulisiibacteriota bacterium]
TRVIKAQLAYWITRFRSVILDATAQKQAVNQVYRFLAQGDPATSTVSEYFQSQGNPFKRAKTEIVSVDISSVLPISDKSWQIEWTETIRNRQGAKKGKPIRMKAAIEILIVPPDREQNILINPLGLYIKQIHWTKQL